MTRTSSSGSELYGLFDVAGSEGNFDQAFCQALAGVLGASDVLVHENRRPGEAPSLRCAFAADIQNGAGAHATLDSSVSSAAAATGEITSHFEPNPRDGNGPLGVLRFAVAVSEGECSLVIEVLKVQSGPEPEERDIFFVRTFGSLLAARLASADSSPRREDASRELERAGPAPVKAVGKSTAFTRAQLLAMKAARNERPVLILGETGTGKELIARQLHEASRRRGKPYVAINCGAITDALLESEFFGHVRGAFTSAYRNRRGRLEEADGGTVFLDEIAEMTPACQVKLLRTLDTCEITPVGSNKTLKIDVRFITATHRNLEQMIQQGKFREDLFYRLSWMRIELPPLRKRRGDTELLARFFLEQEAELQESPARDFAPAAMEVLRAYKWPGNIRELRQVVASAVALAEGERIELEDLPEFLTSPSAAHSDPGGGDMPREDEKARMLKALRATAYRGTGRWNMRAAARSLGINGQTFAYKVRKVYRLKND